MYTIFWFIIITSLYFPVIYYTNTNIYYFVYIILLIIGEYFISLEASKSLCGSNQWITAFLVSFVPWILIFGVISMLLKIFPGWLIPFSNTFGYIVISFAGLSKLIKEIFKPSIENPTAEMKGLQESLAYIYSDQSLIVNEITVDNFNNFWNKVSPLFKNNVKNNMDLKTRLFNLIRIKFLIAEYIWYLLTGVLVASISYNYLVNSKCDIDVKDMQKRAKDLDVKTKEKESKKYYSYE